jgi:uncharacterized protein YoxC
LINKNYDFNKTNIIISYYQTIYKGKSQGVGMHTIRKSTSLTMIIVTIFGIVLMLFFAKMLFDMTNYVGAMTKSVNIMSGEVVSLNKKFDDMNNNMIQIKGSMSTMNENIQSIQSQMARDIDAMSTSVQEMSENMGDMKKDMSKGVNTFTSSRGFMKSLMP